MQEDARGTDALWPGPQDLAARLDRLDQRLEALESLRPALEAALVAQASRIEAVLGAARRDLAEAAVGDHVQAALARAVADGDDRLAEVRAALAATSAPLEALAGAVEALHDRVDTVTSEVAADREAIGGLVERADAVPAAVTDGLAEVVAALEGQQAHAERQREALREQQEQAIEELRSAAADALDAIRRAAVQASDRVLARLDAASERLEQVAAAVASADRTIGEHLTESDRRATLERARLTSAFVEQLADGLTRRERKRLAKRLEVPDAAPPPAPATDPEGPDAPATPDPVPVAEPESVPAPPEPSRPARPVVRAAAPPDEPVPSSTPRVRPSRRTRPVRPAASEPGDPAAVRRALASVRGLGPARQSALIDQFGTLEAIREASDDELLEVRGVGPSLLPGIRDAVRLPD